MLRSNRRIFMHLVGMFSFVCVIVTAFESSALADLFHFRDGRVIHGTVTSYDKVKIDEKLIETWVVELEPGLLIKVYETELKHNGHEVLSQERANFEKAAAAAPATLESLQQQVEYCNRNGMTDIANAIHEYRVDLSPNASELRTAAGYEQDTDGVWRKKHELRVLEYGMVLDGRRWKYPEEIAIERATEERQAKIVEATKDLTRWHATLTNRYTKQGSRRYQDAVTGLSQINNPLATGKLAELLGKKDTPVWLKLKYVELLTRFDNALAANALANSAIVDANDQVRNACLGALRRNGKQYVAGTLLGHLNGSDNLLLNRAADAIAELQIDGAIRPLIEKLITTGVISIGSGGTNASINGSFSTGQSKKTVPIENASVLSALTTLTGQSFGYDKASWIQWFASVNAPPVQDLRRDY